MIKREYYKNGQLRYEKPCHEGQVHGLEKHWYDNGQLYLEIPYHEGQYHGIAKGWWESGELRYKEYYLYGNQVTEKEYRRHELIVKLSGL